MPGKDSSLFARHDNKTRHLSSRTPVRDLSPLLFSKGVGSMLAISA
jgi:hypothetical protein